MVAYSPPKAAGTIPVIDFAPAFLDDPAARQAVADAVRTACRDTGFFYITGHGVPAELMAGQLAAARRFFAQTLDRKMEIRADRSPVMRGYEAIGGQALDTDSPADLKESLMLGRDLGPDHPLVARGLPFEGANPWPRDLAGFQAQTKAYTEAMIRLGRRLTAILALSFEGDETYLADAVVEPNCAVRMLHYPPPPKDAAVNQLGAGAHTDWGLLTILLQDGQGGLEVLNAQGDWIRADPIAGAFVINLGDMVQRLTNGFYRSNFHRVLNKAGGADRYSVATFFNPPFDYRFGRAPSCLLDEAAPEPCTFGDHIQEMMRRTQAIPA